MGPSLRFSLNTLSIYLLVTMTNPSPAIPNISEPGCSYNSYKNTLLTCHTYSTHISQHNILHLTHKQTPHINPYPESRIFIIILNYKLCCCCLLFLLVVICEQLNNIYKSTLCLSLSSLFLSPSVSHFLKALRVNCSLGSSPLHSCFIHIEHFAFIKSREDYIVSLS